MVVVVVGPSVVELVGADELPAFAQPLVSKSHLFPPSSQINLHWPSHTNKELGLKVVVVLVVVGADGAAVVPPYCSNAQ